MVEPVSSAPKPYASQPSSLSLADLGKKLQEHLKNSEQYDNPAYIADVSSTVLALHETSKSGNENAQILHGVLTQTIDVQGKKTSLYQAAKNPAEMSNVMAQIDALPEAKHMLSQEIGLLL